METLPIIGAPKYIWRKMLHEEDNERRKKLFNNFYSHNDVAYFGDPECISQED